MREMSNRVAMNDARMALVVQDSHYKEHRLDLAQVVVEMAEATHWTAAGSRDFTTRTMAALNPATRSYRSSYGAAESVLVFRRAN